MPTTRRTLLNNSGGKSVASVRAATNCIGYTLSRERRARQRYRRQKYRCRWIEAPDDIIDMI